MYNIYDLLTCLIVTSTFIILAMIVLAIVVCAKR
jgi:hypothetical protein